MKSKSSRLGRLACLLALLAGGAQAGASEPAAAAASGHGHLGFNDVATEQLNRSLVALMSANLLGPAALDDLGTYFAPDLIQHDPGIADGRAAMLAWIGKQRALAPARTLTVKHLLADRDLVFVHSQLSATPANEKSGRNRFDIYRLDQGLIVEHWEVSAGVPPETESGNSQFSDLYAYPGGYTAPSEAREEANRLQVAKLSDLVFDQRRFNLLDNFWAADYIQHNPYVGDGRAALAAVIDYIAPAGSNYRVVRSMSDGDLSLVCSQNTDPGVDPGNEFTGAAVCDLYRVANSELVEHWDVAQGVPATSANGHSMFSDLYPAN